MSMEKFNTAKLIVEDIQRIEEEIKRLPRGKHPFKFKRILRYWTKCFPTEKTSDGRFFVTNSHYDNGMIELDDEDVKLLIDKRETKLTELNGRLNNLLEEETG